MSDRRHRVFAYGTLMFPEILEAVTGVRAAGSDALLVGHARYRVRDRTYPALVPEPGGRTKGRLYEQLAAPTLALLDRFEGEMYERCTLSVAVSGHAAPTEAWVYVCRREFRSLLTREPWDPQAFAGTDAHAFLESYRRFRS